MSRTWKLALGFVVTAAIAHLGVVYATPHVLMNVAMKRVSGDWRLVNQFGYGPRTSQTSRNVVRPSPDLAYASCVYDLSGGPLLIEAQPSPDNGYVSLSVFASNTDNIAVFDSIRSPQGIRFVLALEEQTTPPGANVVLSPSRHGIILDRRLAPSAEQFAIADKARRANRCAPLG